MRALSTPEQRPSAFGAEAVERLGGPRWLAERRASALAAFESTPLPSGREEIWRYSMIEELALDDFDPVSRPAGAPGGVPRPVQGLLDRIGERAGLVVTHGGRVVEATLSEAAEARGVRLSAAGAHGDAADLYGSVADYFSQSDRDALDALADAFSAEAVVLSLPRSVEIDEPVVLVHLLDASAEGQVGADGSSDRRAPAAFPRTLVHLEENADVSVVEILVSGGGLSLVVPTVELFVGDGGRLSHHVIQQLGTGSWQLGRLFAKAGRDATIRSFQASLGGRYARSRTDSVVSGQGGTAQLLAAYLGDGRQVHDFRTLQEHAAPRTTSDLVFKGAVGGTSRSVYGGMIHMRKGARGANAFQTNRNLVLSDGAHADSVPNLDIEENDVRCSHASAVGPIEEEQRFYLESRGVPREVAERLIVLGFFEELLERALPAVRDHVVASIRDRVAAMTGPRP